MNAERDCQRLFTKLGMSVNVPIIEDEHQVDSGKVIRTFRIQPQEWIKHWMQTSPEILCGKSADPSQTLESFWACYKEEHSSHPVFEVHGSRLNQVIPPVAHGDEGRALKKTNYLVFSIESVFGAVDDDRLFKCSCAADLESRGTIPSYGVGQDRVAPHHLEVARKQPTNFKGHSYLSRFLIFGLGAWIYKKHFEVVEVLTTKFTTEMRDLFYQGVQLENGQVYFCAILGMKGDMDYHRKLFKLERSYAHLGSINHFQICHQCFAGDSDHPFEDYRERPTWESSMNATRPWNTDQPPVMARLPFDDSAPERLLQGDSFHIYKVGVGRDLAAGILVILLRKGFFDFEGCATNIDARFAAAHSNFSLWCKVMNKSPGLSSFTVHLFGIKNLSLSAPVAKTKGSDTVLLLEWLAWFLKLNIRTPHVDGYRTLLQQMLQVTNAALGFGMMHVHGIWLERACARLLYGHMMTFLRGYVTLGRKALDLRMRAFIQKPKMHALHHLAQRLRAQLESGAVLCLNPQVFACDCNEDFLGRIARLSRRVGFRLVDKRVCERYMLKQSSLLRKRKQIKKPKAQPSKPKVHIKLMKIKRG
eukprot:Skav221281  [mRNA]  locus=scaffold2775:169664:171427:- [translate_table: standard]